MQRVGGGVATELNFESLEMQKWNVPMSRVQRVDEKMGSVIIKQKWFIFRRQKNQS